MTTDLLPPQDLPDADQELARRLETIERKYDGGLAGFFAKLDRERSDLEEEHNSSGQLDLRKLTQLITTCALSERAHRRS
jgi:hypothetical protein